MIINYALLVTFFILIAAAIADDTQLKVKGGSSTNTTEILEKTKTSNGKVGGSELDLDGKKVHSSGKGQEQVEGIQKESGLEKPNLSSVPKSKEAPVVKGSNFEKSESGKKGGVDGGAEGLEAKGKTKKPEVKKDNNRGEECGLPDRCTAEKDALVACLRVPGNESPDLLLLIQNKGKSPLNVKIVAPEFVWLEKAQIQLLENRNERVKVTVKSGGTDNSIILTAGNGNCTLSFKDLITQNSNKETDHISELTHTKLFNRNTLVAFIILAALLLVASIWTCVSFRRRHFQNNASKYQKLDTELPVTDGTKLDPEPNAGWDDSWGDSWDDEEAPKTPSMPITPSFSPQRVSSRRVNKDGWKD